MILWLLVTLNALALLFWGAVRLRVVLAWRAQRLRGTRLSRLPVDLPGRVGPTSSEERLSEQLAAWRQRAGVAGRP